MIKEKDGRNTCRSIFHAEYLIVFDFSWLFQTKTEEKCVSCKQERWTIYAIYDMLACWTFQLNKVCSINGWKWWTVKTFSKKKTWNSLNSAKCKTMLCVTQPNYARTPRKYFEQLEIANKLRNTLKYFRCKWELLIWLILGEGVGAWCNRLIKWALYGNVASFN